MRRTSRRLHREAIQFSLQRGSRSGRVAWQFARARTPAHGAARGKEALISSAIVRVAAAILRRADGRVLLAQRLAGRRIPDIGSSPAGSSSPASLLRTRSRGSSTRSSASRSLARRHGWSERYAYPHAEVELNFFRVLEWRGEPHGRDGQAIAWQAPGAFDVAPLLPANAAILRALELPAVYGITMAEELGEELFSSGLAPRSRPGCG